jgi:hypothetical protein
MIDGFGNLNWRKSFRCPRGGNKEKAGEWKFQIDASKAMVSSRYPPAY